MHKPSIADLPVLSSLAASSIVMQKLDRAIHMSQTLHMSNRIQLYLLDFLAQFGIPDQLLQPRLPLCLELPIPLDALILLSPAPTLVRSVLAKPS